MIKNIAILVVLLLAGTIYTVAETNWTKPAVQSSLAQTAPSFDFKDLNGKIHRLEDFSGKVVIVNFWASWCAPCVIEFPQMLRLADITKKDSIFLFLSLDTDKKDIERFLKKLPVKLTENVIIGIDSDAKISKDLFGTYKLPETYILTPDARISEKIVGADIVWDDAAMRHKIESLARR